MIDESQKNFANLAVARLIADEHAEKQAQHGACIPPDDLHDGPAVVLDATVVKPPFELHLDAILKTPGRSSFGEFHYLPVLFNHESTIREQHRLLLAFVGVMLGALQGCQSQAGVVVYAETCKMSTVGTAKYEGAVRKIAEALHAIATAVHKPQVMLCRHCPFCQFHERCTDEAMSKDDLSLLRGISDKEIKKYNRKGIFTVNQLSYTFRPRRKGHRVKSRDFPYYHSLQALALREKKVYVFQKPNLPNADTRVYVDLEGDSNAGSVYLVGALVVQNGVEKMYSLWADDTGQEEYVFAQFVDILQSLDEPYIFHYGNYETHFFKRMLAGVSDENISRLLTNRSVNILSGIYSKVYFPVYSNSLKEIAGFLGCTWSAPAPSGLQSIVWRNEWERTGDSDSKKKLIEYNEEDCAALRTVTEFLHKIASAEASELENTVSQTMPADEDDGRHTFGKKRSVIEDFDAITQCAYFEYQRDKVFLRTSGSVQKAARRKRKRAKVKYRVNKTVELRGNRCPYCGSSNLLRDRTQFHAKISLDVTVSPSGIKRRITRLRAAFHLCRECGRHFVPRAYKREPRFGHSLVAWTIYQHVVTRATFEHIEKTARECFGLPIGLSEVHSFKKLAAEFYKRTYNQLLTRIVNGHLIHADETTVKLQHDSGYVWIFANMDTVVFMYKPTRDSGFLKPLLKGFQGVLVSDFFTGYDSLHCAQQKCIVHLIRDINDELLKNPFDNELKVFAQGFGALMKDIVRTTDRFGLRKRHMKKHLSQVQKFFEESAGAPFTSDVAEKLRKRVVKYREKLFVFLEHDEVPWNNNNAEHAVKYFAKYRRLVNGRITERGLTHYLVLLSLYITCEYRGIRFLDFLLSGEKDLDKFVDGL